MQQSGGSLLSSSNSSTRTRKERRVTCQLCRTDGLMHCGGINAVAISPDSRFLFTASRDSTIKRWDLSRGQPRFDASLEGHVDWVNDLALIGDTLVSCSSDRSINLWRASSPGGSLLASFMQHSDYVTCLAAAQQREWVASAGLRGEIMLWDIAAGAQQANGFPRPCELRAAGEDGSVYALAITPSGRVLASGCINRTVHVWDPRQQGPVMTLKGHGGNVRALSMNEDGTIVLSAGSDHKIRLWDLGQQRCGHVFGIHSDSIWSLQATTSFGHVYSGGRDGTVFRTCLSTRTSTAVLQESGPVLDLAVETGLLEGSEVLGSVWVGTTSSSVNCWKVPAHQELRGAGPASGGGGAGGVEGWAASSAPSARRLATQEARAPPLVLSPALAIEGCPPLTHHKVLNDRRHVLTKDSQGAVELWDLTIGAVVKRFGCVDFKETEKSLFQAISVPQWFTIDTKTGSLQLHLDSPQCFLAEIYAQDLGMSKAADDFKLNFGEQMLKGMFSSWAVARGLRVAASSQAPPDQPQSPAESPKTFEGIQGHFVFTGGREAKQVPPPPLPLIIAESRNGRPWRRRINGFDGTEAEGDDVPGWVAECVLFSRLPTQREMKCAFVLQPAEGSSLPSMLQTRLNAPRILRVGKVASYALTKLAEQDIPMIVQPPVWDMAPGWVASAQPQQPPQPNSQGLPVLDITCNKMAVPFEMSLESVRAFIWKRSDDLVLEYQERPQGAQPPTAPHFQPPA